MNRTNNFLNTLSLLTALIILAMCYFARMGLPAYVSGFNYFGLFALAAILFSLPDFICYYFPAKNKWYRSAEFSTVFIIIFMGLVGLLLSKNSTWILIMVLPIGIALAFWEFYQFLGSKDVLAMAAGLAYMVFMVFLFYSQFTHSFLFPERIVLGVASSDTLFHSSMSNMFSTLGWASTGLNGAPYIHYHWGSHALFAGLKNWTGLNTLMFYNLAYPAIFLPLLIKSLFNFTERLFNYHGINHFNKLFAFSFLLMLYSLPIAHFQNAQPLVSESFAVASIFVFLYAATLLAYISDSGQNRHVFYLYSLLTVTLITFFKISNGFVCASGMAYLYLKSNWNLKSLMKVIAGSVLLSAFIYFLLFQINYLAKPLPLIGRIQNFWLNSDGFLTYFLGAFIAMMVVLRNQSLSSWREIKNILRSGKYLDLEALFILTIAGICGGIVASSHNDDVKYFCTVQLVISLPFLILFAQKSFDGFRAGDRIKKIFLFLIIIFSVLSRPDVIKGLSREIMGGTGSTNAEKRGSIAAIMKVKREMRELTQQQRVLNGFIDELIALDKMSSKKTKCIYIPHTEKWFYESQKFRANGSPLVVPAISGIAMIGGFPDNIMKVNDFSGLYYGYAYYKKNDQINIPDTHIAEKIALKYGYDELFNYQLIDGKLVKRIFALKLHSQDNVN